MSTFLLLVPSYPPSSSGLSSSPIQSRLSEGTEVGSSKVSNGGDEEHEAEDERRKREERSGRGGERGEMDGVED